MPGLSANSAVQIELVHGFHLPKISIRFSQVSQIREQPYNTRPASKGKAASSFHLLPAHRSLACKALLTVPTVGLGVCMRCTFFTRQALLHLSRFPRPQTGPGKPPGNTIPTLPLSRVREAYLTMGRASGCTKPKSQQGAGRPHLLSVLAVPHDHPESWLSMQNKPKTGNKGGKR